MTPAAFLVLCLPALGGAALTYLYDHKATMGARLGAGFCTGTTALGFLGYLFASHLGMTAPALIVPVLLTLTPLFVFTFPACRARLCTDLFVLRLPPRRLRSRRLLVSLATLCTVAFFVWLFRGIMYRENGAIYTTNHLNLGDLPFHLALIAGFVRGDNFPPIHPEFAGTRLTYPFLVDFMASQLVQAGASEEAALFWQNLLLALSLTGLLFRFALKATRSVFAALATPLLVFFSGGAGGILLWADARSAQQPFGQLLLHLPRDYTTNTDLRWGNALTTLFTTQRGLLLAVPLALLVWILWWEAGQYNTGKARRLGAAGCIAGLLPLVHGHTFLMLMLVGGCYALRDLAPPASRRTAFRAWAAFFASAALLALPQLWFLAQKTGVQSGSFFGWQPGWDKGDVNFFVFWYKNLFLFIPLLFVALFGRGKNGRPFVPPHLVRFYLPFTLCFVVPNLVRLAPWVWDNIKVLFYWHAASAPLIALFLARLWKRGIGRRIIALILLGALTFSGALDVLRITSHTSAQQVFDAEGIAFADDVARVTPPHTLILHAPVYNHPVLLAGRHLLMGYPGHLWSHGLNYAAREEDVRHMYAGAADANALLARYKVDYVVVGPPERTADRETLKLNAPFFARFPVVVERGSYRLYALPKNW